MIMSCIKSTSACDRGGSVALVDGGSVLLGFPGAPGCTSTGFSITLLCARGGAEGSCGSARCEQHAIEHGEYLRRVELALAARTIKPRLRCTAKYFHLDSEESLPLNINIFKNCFQAEATCPFQALRTSPLRCVSAAFVCSISLLCATQSSVKLCMRFYHMAPWVPFEDASSSAATKRSHKR